MCTPVPYYPDPEKAETLLAREFKNELGVTVSDRDLRKFIRSRWNKIATLAHRIHDAQDAQDDPLEVAARNIAALSKDGILNVINGKAGASPALQRDFLIIADKIKSA